MIRTYKYIKTEHDTLNDYVLAFFKIIETDTNGFRGDLFEPKFLQIVNRHPQILKNRFKKIYNYVSNLSVTDRRSFCQRIIDCNQIEKICCGEYKPEAFTNELTEINKTLKELFLDLYKQVLDGDAFQEVACTTLRDHFNQFCDTNKDITLCPICGIVELKKSQDEFRDQYDHYLPKSLYPFSAVNFYNMVPCCKECNSLEVKGSKDTIAVSTGKLFFPYDPNHKGISLTVHVGRYNPDFEKIDWQLTFNNPENKNDEIESWKRIWLIESRYQGFIKGRIMKWYKHFYEYIKSKKAAAKFGPDESKEDYMLYLELEESLGLKFIEPPVLRGLLACSEVMQGFFQSSEYRSDKIV